MGASHVLSGVQMGMPVGMDVSAMYLHNLQHEVLGVRQALRSRANCLGALATKYLLARQGLKSGWSPYFFGPTRSTVPSSLPTPHLHIFRTYTSSVLHAQPQYGCARHTDSLGKHEERTLSLDSTEIPKYIRATVPSSSVLYRTQLSGGGTTAQSYHPASKLLNPI
jgi:hypothetical protein